MESGLHLILNIKDIPQDFHKDLELKLFLHESGSIPDVLTLDSNYIEIFPQQETKIGIDNIISNEASDNFNDMKFEKRNCLKAQERFNYSRTNCLIEEIYQHAQEICQCIPRTLKIKNEYGYPKCNITGAYCFRNTVSKGKSIFGQKQCPLQCTNMFYKASKSVYNRSS